MARVLVVEDEADIALGLREDLAGHGHHVEVVTDGAAAIRAGRDGSWDVILLDIMLPHKDGLEVCRELRAGGVTTPIILLTARTQEIDKVLGLELGADDYVTKPFSPSELRARIKAVIRRHDTPLPDVYCFGDCEVDFGRGEIRRAGLPIDVTAQEFRLLSALIRARGRVLSRQQMIALAWGDQTFIGDRVVDTHVLNLRKKIEPAPSAPRYLRSVRGIGYRFDG